MYFQLLLTLVAIFGTIVTGNPQDPSSTTAFDILAFFTTEPPPTESTTTSTTTTAFDILAFFTTEPPPTESTTTTAFDILAFFTTEPLATESTTTSTTTTELVIEDTNVPILSDFKTKELPNRSVCGLEKEANRIIGGTIADIDEFPWTVGLEYQRKISPYDNVGVICGGSLINNRYVLTAAHCILNKEFQLVAVRLGEWNTTSDPDCLDVGVNQECADPVKRVAINQIIPHPFYIKQSSNNDIALLRLNEDITYTDYIRPICLPPYDLPYPELGTKFTVAGWGIKEDGNLSQVKLKLQLPLLHNDECNQKLADGQVVSPNQLCAGGEEGKDSCQGDSGGPLMRIYSDRANRQPQWYLEGVVSWGSGCALKGIPAIYSRVSRYISWIINEISENPE